MSDRPTLNQPIEATRIGASQSDHAETVLPTTSVASAGRFAWLAITLLTLTNTLNHLDRQIIGILAEPIKHEFGLNDGQLGLLTGLAFAALYGIASLPMAWIADRGNRPLVISLSVATWSLFTALGAAVQNFTQLVLARVMVGLTEAGGSAPAQALISDMAPRNRRAMALAIFQVGIPLGGFFGLAVGGILLDNLNWRAAFLVAGLPGLVLAPIVFLMIPEPRKRVVRRVSEPAQPPRLAQLLRDVGKLLKIRSFLLITIGGICVTTVNYGQTSFLAAHFMRTHQGELSTFAATGINLAGLMLGSGALLGSLLGLAKGLPGVFGTLWGGQLSDQLSNKRMEWIVMLPAIACWLRAPMVVGIFLAPNLPIAITFVVLQAIITGVAAPAGYASVLGLTLPSQRALAASLYMLGLNVVGLGLGPVAVGLASDALQRAGLSSAEGLRYALTAIGVVGLALGGWLKWIARSSIRRELIS